jgi:hypothetical protein
MIPHYISEDNAALLVCAGVPDTMLGTDTFFSIKTNPADLLSKARSAKAVLEKNGNFIIYTGSFSPEGRTGLFGSFIGFQSKDLPGATEFYKNNSGPYKMNLDNGLAIIDINTKNALPIFKLNKASSGKKTLQLDNTGNLNFRINGFPIWTLKPKGQPIPRGTSSKKTSVATALTPEQITAAAAAAALPAESTQQNNYLLPIGAALAAFYFFLKK